MGFCNDLVTGSLEIDFFVVYLLQLHSTTSFCQELYRNTHLDRELWIKWPITLVVLVFFSIRLLIGPMRNFYVQDLLLQLDPYKSMGLDRIHPRILKGLADVITKCLFWVVLGIQKFQVTRSWQILSWFSGRARGRSPETTGLSLSP